jgi:hypothetical protein
MDRNSHSLTDAASRQAQALKKAGGLDGFATGLPEPLRAVDAAPGAVPPAGLFRSLPSFSSSAI